MNIIEFAPQGFCKGVINAISIINRVIENPTIPRPIHLLGALVHNKQITEAIKQKGVIVLDGHSRDEMLDQVTTGTVVITAHGVSPKIYEKVKSKNLYMIDSTCKDVTRTHNIIKDKLKLNYTVLFIGKKGHPETEGVLGIDERIVLIENQTDIDNLSMNDSLLCVTNQTTMSLYDIFHLFEGLKEKFPQIELIDELCLATKQRQQAVLEQSKLCDLVIVVGDKTSNNCKKLTEIAKNVAKKDVVQIESIEELDLQFVKQYHTVGITSAASTPYAITKEVIDVLEQIDDIDTSFVKSSLNLPDLLQLKKHR